MDDTWWQFAVGLFIGVLGLIVGLLSMVRSNKLKRQQVINLRKNLHVCRRLVYHTWQLNKYRRKYGITSDDTVSQLAKIDGRARTLLESTLSDLSQLDTPWNQKKLQFYVDKEMISSKWLFREAAKFAESSTSVPEHLPDDMQALPYLSTDNCTTTSEFEV